MDAIDAAKAVEFLGAANVIPLHYNTWDVIKQNPEDLLKLVKDAKVHIVKPGQSIELA
jgi:L-ascorbate metabolism protein UlaG (beta-lactamase superfamily)